MSHNEPILQQRDDLGIPATMYGPEADFVRWVNDPNQETHIARRADPYSILGMPAYWAGVGIVSDRCGYLPLELWKPEGDRREPLTKHPVRKLCCKSFTPWMPSQAGITTLVANCLRFGNSFALIGRSNGIPDELTILNPDLVQILPFESPDGRIVPYYRVTRQGQQLDYPWTDIIHLKGLNQTGLTGFSVSFMLNTALSLGLNIYRHSEKYFERNCAMSMYITTPPEAKVDNVKAKELINQFLASVGRGQPPVLAGGATLSSFNDNAEEAQLESAKNFNLVDVANVLKVPVSTINGQQITSYSSLEADERRMLTNGLNAFLFQIETEFGNKLLSSEEIDQGIEFQFDRSSLDCPALTERITGVLGLVKGGIISKHEGRIELGYSGPAPSIEVQPLAVDVNAFVVNRVVTPEEARATLGLTGPAPEPLPPPSPDTPPDEPKSDPEALRSIAVANLERLFERLKRSSKSVSPKWCGSHRKVFLKSFPNKTGPINKFFRGLKQELEATSKDDHEKIITYRTENNTLLEDIINE